MNNGKKKSAHYYIVNMALYILNDAHCPHDLLQPIAKWAWEYNGLTSDMPELSEEEMGKMKLIKWQEWAKRGLERSK